jgi:hypothetical protein
VRPCSNSATNPCSSEPFRPAVEACCRLDVDLELAGIDDRRAELEIGGATSPAEEEEREEQAAAAQWVAPRRL